MASSGRTYFVMANLDELNTLAISLRSEEDRASAFGGLISGCNALRCATTEPDAFKRAWEVGVTWRAKAEEDRAKASKAGHASVAARKKKHGSAQPGRTTFEQPSNDD